MKIEQYLLFFSGFFIFLACAWAAIRSYRKIEANLGWIWGIFWSLSLVLVWTSIHFPAVMSVDSFMVLDEAVSGKYLGQHPVIWGLIVRVFYKIFGLRIEAFTIFQGWVLYFSVFFFLKALMPRFSKRFFWTMVFVTLYTPLWIYSVTIWKDTLLAIQFCFLAGFLIRFLQNYKRRDLIASWIFLTLAILARHNAVFIVVPVAVFLFYASRKSNSFLKFQWPLKILFVGIFSVSPLVVSSALNRITGSNPESFRDLVFVTTYASWSTTHFRSGKTADPEAYAFWNEALRTPGGYDYLVRRDPRCGDEWTYIMDPKLNTHNTTNALKSYEGGLKGLMLRFLAEHPLTVARYVLCNSRRLADGTGAGKYWYHLGISDNAYGIVANGVSSKLHGLMKKILYYSFRSGISEHWVFLNVAAAFLIMWVFSKKEKVQKVFKKINFPEVSYLVVPSLCLAYYASFVVVPAATDWRYLFPTTLLICTMILAALAELAVNFNAKKAP